MAKQLSQSRIRRLKAKQMAYLLRYALFVSRSVAAFEDEARVNSALGLDTPAMKIDLQPANFSESVTASTIERLEEEVEELEEDLDLARKKLLVTEKMTEITENFDSVPRRLELMAELKDLLDMLEEAAMTN
ncbi:hypothetical protein BJ508DRAFT_313575 [Ascobolus immersus RN42]|uniref:Uncharacterized protein n=1 Tax=Ascobolus immersus RN42 TaxID=1160509 RepID=A0A3N4HLE0_ASCIM|nr:hypothetical protein BJ508DRAFT_313575 [Ascobolus immersus RN42]